MKNAEKFLLPLLAVFFIMSLLVVNRDLFHYEYTYPYSRSFSPEETAKGNYLVTDPVPLKKGTYEVIITGCVDRTGSGLYLVNAQDEVIYAADLVPGAFNDPYRIDLPANTSVRIGFSYDPASGVLSSDRVRMQSSSVLYMDSVVRHLLLSAIVVMVFVYLGLRLLKKDLPEAVKNKTGIDLPAAEKIFGILLILTLLASWPMFDRTRFMAGDDFFFHLSRVEGMALSMKAGYFPPRILLGWMENYGVGCGFYYPDMFMLLPACLCMIGVTAVDALRIFLIVCTFFSLLSVYLCAANLSDGSRIAGITAAALYAFAAYRLTCVYYRNAIGEVQAYIFSPLILWGLTAILRGNVNKWKVFALGFFGLLMSHLISLAVFGILCAVCLLFYLPRMFRNRSILTALVKAFVITVLLGAFFLLPMAEQAAKNELGINELMQEPFEVKSSNLMPFYCLFLPYNTWNMGNFTARAYPGYALLAVPLLRLFLLFRKEKHPRVKTADLILLAGLILLTASTDFFPWRFFLFKWFLSKIQFSWRLLGAASMLLCAAGGEYFDMIYSAAHRKKAVLGIMLAAAVLSGFPILAVTFSIKMHPIEKLNTGNKIISGAEYMPPHFDYMYLDQKRDRVMADETKTSVYDARRQNLGFVFSFERLWEGDALNYSLPLIYYYGYISDLTDADGKERKIPVSRDENGLVQVSDEGLPAGTIRIRYEKTAVQKAGEMISICTLLFLCFLVFRRDPVLKGKNE